MESISEKAADFMYLNINSLVTMRRNQFIKLPRFLIEFKLNLNKLCNSKYKLD